VSLYIGLDVGTQSTKALIWDAEIQTVVSRGHHSYGLDVDENGKAEQHPSVWIEAVNKSLAKALKNITDRQKIKGIGVSGQQHGFVALDKKNIVIRPAKLWCDTETHNEAEDLSNIAGKEISVRYTASKILWMKRKEPDSFKRLDTVLLPHDYINFYLTGQKVMEAGDASGTGFFDIENRNFDKKTMMAIDDDLEGSIPKLVDQFKPIGSITREISELFGISKQTIVSPGSGDNMMSALGSGILQSGTLAISLGTSGTVFCHSEKCIQQSDPEISAFCDAIGGWLPLFCLNDCALELDALTDRFGLNHEDLAKISSQNPNQKEGKIYLNKILNITRSLKRGYDKIRNACGGAKEIRVVGGGAKNKLWVQTIANTFNSDISVLSEFDTASLGAAIQASMVNGCKNNQDKSIKEIVKPNS
tara:strand:- start:3323 stop:4576 length:1254 start_codon:yes stop_codon:yes gene_type:complete